ncbi:MAG: hypothetical protein D6776_11170 [Planctomycetota bacterium]|nr:MAG: hypothetical protein D6776_11170 [Planctomycetota bacterium]
MLATVAGLWRRQPHGAMISIPELLEALGLDRLDEIAPVLLRLVRARQLRLEPISDPLGLPAAERAFVIHDRVKGELFYITPGTASSPARRP